MSALSQIAELLHHRCGFAVTESSLASLRHALERRMEETGAPSMEDYQSFLAKSSQELSELVEATIVSETFFFRYPESFAALRKWVAAQSRRPIRILSLACATGEEPYTIAMSLLDEGLKPGEFVIEATDISEYAVSMARKGFYGGKSFRSGDHDQWRDRHFIHAGPSWEVRPHLRNAVTFRQANLLDLRDHAAWDIIFCRNVLIYFSGAKRTNVVSLLDRALAGDGLLFLGPAEPAAFLEHHWKLAGYPMSFACVKGIHSPVSAAAPRPKPATLSPKPRPAPAPPLAGPVVLSREQSPALPATVAMMERARFLANAGELDESDAVLSEILRLEPESIDGHFLCGLVQEVQGRLKSAEASYRKVLFLDPAHIEALQHMTLLLRNQGRSGAAEHLTRRVNRHIASS